MKVALVSLNASWENKDKSKLKVIEHLQAISPYSVEWVLFPEMTLTGFTMNTEKCAEDFYNSSSIGFFKEQAIKYRLYISFGIILKGRNNATNNLITVSPQGEIITSYAKIHPFSYAKEDVYYESGKEIVVANIANADVGMSICYDLRFPEMFQALSKTCEIIVNIASWPRKRIEHWSTLLRARAIENQVFFIGVNRTGQDGNNLNYQKSSAVISPDGELLVGNKVNDETDIFDINVKEVDMYREKFPVKNDRQPNLYKQIL